MDGAYSEDRGDVGYVEYQESEQDPGEESLVKTGIITQHKKGRVTWQDLKEKIMQSAVTMSTFFLRTSYIPAIICMMVSTLLYVLRMMCRSFESQLRITAHLHT